MRSHCEARARETRRPRAAERRDSEQARASSRRGNGLAPQRRQASGDAVVTRGKEQERRTSEAPPGYREAAAKDLEAEALYEEQNGTASIFVAGMRHAASELRKGFPPHQPRRERDQSNGEGRSDLSGRVAHGAQGAEEARDAEGAASGKEEPRGGAREADASRVEPVTTGPKASVDAYEPGSGEDCYEALVEYELAQFGLACKGTDRRVVWQVCSMLARVRRDTIKECVDWVDHEEGHGCADALAVHMATLSVGAEGAKPWDVK
jgi:hypothetical protein